MDNEEQDRGGADVATAGVNRMMLWTDLEGREVEGGWRLKRLVRPEGRMAWFEATGTDGRAAMLSLTEALNDEEDLLARLRAAAEIRHPNVMAIWDAQLAWVEDTPVVVAAMEPTEENLGDVLRERALSVDEDRAVMDALLAGLAAIHRKKLVHGRMEAGSVLAMGDTIKLRSDCLQIPGTAFATKAAEDVRGAARIVVQALTRRLPSGENDPVLQLLPDPMARAVRRALSGNATVEEVATLAGTRLTLVTDKPAAARESRVVPEVKTPARVEPLPKPEEPAAKTPVTAAPVPETAKPSAVSPAAELPAARAVAAEAPPQAKARPAADPRLEASRLLVDDEEPEWDRRRSAPYVIGGAVVLLLITFFVLYGLMHRSSGTKHPAQQAAAAPAIAAPAAPAAAVATVKPSPQMGPAGAPATAGPDWHVIVYTYSRRADAEKKAAELAKRYPQLQPAVFEPKSGSPYLVTLGGTMTRSEAINLRMKALRMGMPRDTYARNYR